ncbi:MAG: DUF6148 family protein [Oscillospiraceae bacterium]|nr:DUF6148 family protein [Oscillospiraceae bacterium]
MAGIDLQTAEKHLAAWLEAELELTTHQSYRIGTRWLTKADLKEVRNQIKYWQGVVNQLKGRGRNRVYRGVLRDN